MNLKIIRLEIMAGLTAFLIGAAFFTSAQASGILFYETGTPGVGLGSAGYAASAQDASTLYYNPAGMMRLGKSESLLGVQAAAAFLKFSPNPGLSLNGNDGEHPILWVPTCSYYYVADANASTKMGFGIFSNFGTGAKAGDNWSGRYNFQSGGIAGLTLMPAVAHRFDNRWSVGMAINATYGIYRYNAAINNGIFDPLIGDGKIEVKDNKWGFGGNIGLLYEADKKTRFGLTYNSPVKLDFSTSPTYTNLNPVLGNILRNKGLYNRQIDLAVTIPQQVMLGFTKSMNSRWTIMGDVGWQNWGDFTAKEVSLDSTLETVNVTERQGKDTWHGALGAQYKASPKWTYSFGVGYDTSAFNEGDHPSFMPIGATWRYGVGVSKTLSPAATLNLGYERLVTGTATTDQATVRGAINVFTINYLRKM